MTTITEALKGWRKKACSSACAAQCHAAKRHITRFTAVGRMPPAEERRLYAAAMKGEWPKITWQPDLRQYYFRRKDTA